MDKVRVLIVDDSAVMRKIISSALQKDPAIEVVGFAANGLQAIEAVKTFFDESKIKLSAQCYLKKFYNNLGFKEVGEEYLEDDIPHICMIKS